MPLYIILYHTTLSDANLKVVFLTNELTKDWLLVEWNRRRGVLLGKQGMLVLVAFKEHLTSEIEATVTCCLMDADHVAIHNGLPRNCRS